jgi:phosphoribosylglycinamide formyltransferase 1
LTTKLAILASGRGTDFRAIAEHVSLGILKNITIVGLLCNHDGAQVIERAHSFGIPCKVIQGVSGRKYATLQDKEVARSVFDKNCIDVLHNMGADLIALAGFDQILSATIVDSFEFRILNIHPAYDLRRFGGRNMVGRKVHEEVLKSGAEYSGCTIHFVTNDIDGGPILLKRMVEISPKDSPESLELKILRQEHLAYPEAIQLVADGRVKLVESGKRCFVDRYSDGWDIEWDTRQKKYISIERNEEF